MPDNPKLRGAADRRQVARLQDHEVRYAAQVYDTSMAEVRRVIKQKGNDRDKVYAELARRQQRRD